MSGDNRARARNIKMILMDVDGTLTDGTLILLPDGEVAVTAVGKYVKLALEGIADMDPETLGWRVYE